MTFPVLIQASLLNVLFYGGSLLLGMLACRWALRHEAERGTAWVAFAGLVLAASPWVFEDWLPAVDPDWATGPAPTRELRTGVWSDSVIGVAVSAQQPRAGGVTLNRRTRWASPVRTALAFLSIVGGLVAAAARSAPLRRAWHLIPPDRRRSLHRSFSHRANVVRSAPDAMGPDVRARLVAHYRPDVARLAEVLGRPLPWPELAAPA